MITLSSVFWERIKKRGKTIRESPSKPLVVQRNNNTRKNSEMCSKVNNKDTKQRHWCRSDVEKYLQTVSGDSIVNFEHVFA